MYTLYNTNNGYVVAAVVVGEDDSVTNGYAYAIGGLNKEYYNKSTGEWTWSRDAIVGGEKVTLEETGSTLSAKGINSMSAGSWYKVSYKGDGTVKKVDAITFADTGDYIQNFPAFNALGTSAKRDVVLVQNSVSETTYGHELQMKGYTLHLKKDLSRDTGIDVLSDCKAVVLEKVDGKIKVEYFDGAANNVRNAVDFLYKNPYNGFVYAVMKDGLASVVIFDTTGYNQTSTEGPVVNTGKLKDLAIVKKDNKLQATWSDDGSYDGNTVNVSFYLLDGGKAYLKDTATGTCTSSTTHSQSSTSEIKQNGDYYAVIEIVDNGEIVASAVTAVASFAF